MGFFSFLTNDTEESISNKYSIKPTFTIHMLDNKGNVWTENNYEGYGVLIVETRQLGFVLMKNLATPSYILILLEI
jgi:hypothetical protein